MIEVSEQNNAQGFEIEDGKNDEKNQTYIDTTRAGFIRKVFGILAIQLILTALLIAVSFYPPYAKFLVSHPGRICLVLSFSLYMITLFSLLCCSQVYQKVPVNYLLLFTFTICLSYILQYTCVYYDTKSILIAAIMAASVTVGVSVYSLTTSRDFTMCTGAIFGGFFLLLSTATLCLFFRSRIMELVYSSIACVLYCFYLGYDMQMISGKYGAEYGIDDYIIAALSVYLDIINIFLEILKIIGRGNN